MFYRRGKERNRKREKAKKAMPLRYLALPLNSTLSEGKDKYSNVNKEENLEEKIL